MEHVTLLSSFTGEREPARELSSVGAAPSTGNIHQVVVEHDIPLISNRQSECFMSNFLLLILKVVHLM